MIYFTSDLHLGHKNIIEYCKRPFTSLDEMHETLIRNWNRQVADKDWVWILGDLVFGKKEFAKPLIQQLSGRKMLILGNHDRHSKKFYYDLGFEFVGSDWDMADGTHLSHFPPFKAWEYSGNLWLHGHCHGRPTGIQHAIDVGVDCWNFTPVSYEHLQTPQ